MKDPDYLSEDNLVPLIVFDKKNFTTKLVKMFWSDEQQFKEFNSLYALKFKTIMVKKL